MMDVATLNKQPLKNSAGRPKGSPNKTTALLKDAIIQAAEASGLDRKGKGGLVGYCTFLARDEPKAFAQLLGKVLPTQVAGDPDNPLTVITRIELVAPSCPKP